MDLNRPPRQLGDEYKVFLSFYRGKETPESFPSRLYSSLRADGFSVFKNDISTELLQSINIKGRKTFIIIFSRQYASSRMCLEELTKIMKFRRPYDHVVLPIFYDVGQSDVRNQESSFGEAFQGLIQRISPTDEEVSSWRTVLREAAGKNYGFDVADLESKYDSEWAIQSIIKRVRSVLGSSLHASRAVDGLVGVDCRAQDVIAMLHNHKAKHVVSIGIWGMVGIGKTTIARAIFDHIQYEFESACFLPFVRAKRERNVDLVSAICESTDMRMHGTEAGSLELKERACDKKVLFVLDNVNQLEQLNTLCGSREQFGEGSVIIITTRDSHLLKAFQVDDIHRMKLLSDQESLQLLGWTALKQAYPEEKFTNLCKHVAAYAEGLPLALRVARSFLYLKLRVEWESAVREMSRVLHRDIYNKLRLSFDSLNAEEKEIFLSIVLFHIGEDMDDVIQKLESAGCSARIGIGVLEARGLVTIEDNKLRMHNLLLHMGRQIIRENSQKELGYQGNKYEVLLSFSRYKDIEQPFRHHFTKWKVDYQESFASRLHSSLLKAGISVLKDDISIELSRSIMGGPKISIIIFHEEYAGFRRNLEELTKIMQFHSLHDHIVLPIFYRLNRDEVISFGGAFQNLIKRISPTQDEVSRWRTAVSEAGGNNGFDVNAQDDESDHIENIVEHVHYMLNGEGLLSKDDGLVGVSSQMQEVITMLGKHGSKDVVSIGIWGMAGIGKTTLARLIFEQIQHEFESACFLPNVREEWEKKDLFSVICEATDGSIESGSLELNEIPCRKKALVVVDDVNDLEQLKALRGNWEWFGEGSRIIITTRDYYLLPAFRVNRVYTMKLLSDRESLKLFNRKLFQQASPKGEFLEFMDPELYEKVVAYAEGLPLALEVLSSFLNGQSPMEWKSALMKLSKYLPPHIYDTLKLCFDSLDGSEKEIFLNIVEFYIGEDKNDVIQKLHGCGYHASVGMSVLEDRNLVSIDKDNKLRMHKLFQVMGRQIIRESSLNDLRNRDYRYEVFLSFRGEDTRATFTSHLYTALCNASITAFKDDVELPRGNHIKTELLQAIGSSKISIIIFSRDYARSKWCLEELSIIMELHRLHGQVVLSVFYDVDPSEIRHQTSRFGEAFIDLIQRNSSPENEVSTWKTALVEAAGIAGVTVLGSRDESENVKAVVERVCDILDKKDLFVAEHPIGVDNRVQEVITMLQNHQSEDAVMVGIWGMGGVGKTTIAKAIYNEIGRTFESRSYLSNIRKVWHQKRGKEHLQNKLLSEMCKTIKMKINSIESGIITLKDRLNHKKALVVLDDVDKLAQLKALVGSRDWFKPGSIIIITTRNQRLLFEMDCCVYMMKNLDEGESIELFSWHAFKQESPEDEFIDLSRDIVAYSGGLPLALEVLGSYLFGREVEEWKSVLKKLKKIPHNKIHKKLKISYDGLDDLEKEIFLDICCFFIGMDKNEVTQILNGCEFYADIGIRTLIERSLLTIDEKNKLVMHDLLRGMGREVIRQQSEKEPGNRSRLWFHKEARAVLSEHMGTEAIEGLSLKLSQSKQMHFQTEACKMMKRLRLLHFDDVQLRGDYNYISKNLRWLCWHGFPLKYIPSNFYQKKLVSINLENSSLRRVWKESQILKMLKILNLSHSPYLKQTPDFSKLPNLEKLILKDCPRLSMIHDSIGHLHKLLLLDLEDCIGLHSLPRSIYRLKCLKTLILSGCLNIEKLEEDIEQMESLTTLVAPTIKQVPYSLVRLKSILNLSISGHDGLACCVIPSLYQSWISPTNNPLPHIPTHADMPSSILSNMLNSIPISSTIPNNVPKQQSLLLEIPDSFCATNCMDTSRLVNCLEHLLIQIGKNSQVFCTLSKRISQGLNLTKYSDDCIFPRDNYPYWLTFKGEGGSVKFKMPPVNGPNHLNGMSICCVYIPSGDLDNKACESCIIYLMIINYTKTTTLLYTEDKLKSLEEAERKEIISNLEPDDLVEVKAVFGNGFTVKNTAVYLMYNESFDEQMEPSISEAVNLTGTKHKCEEEEEKEAYQSIRPRKAMKFLMHNFL